MEEIVKKPSLLDQLESLCDKTLVSWDKYFTGEKFSGFEFALILISAMALIFILHIIAGENNAGISTIAGAIFGTRFGKIYGAIGFGLGAGLFCLLGIYIS